MRLLNRVAVLKFLDATVGFALCWVLGGLRYCFSARPSGVGLDLRSARRCLIVRPGGMGDMILLLPVVARVRREFPHLAIDIVCENRNMEVLRLAGLGREAIPYDSAPLRLLWALFRRRYDLAIDSEQFHNFSAVLAFWSGAPVRIGFKINPNRNQLYTHLINYAMDGYEGVQFMQLLRPLGIRELEYRLEGGLRGMPTCPGTDTARRLDRLREAGPFVAVAPSGHGRYKRWDAAKFAELARTWVAERAMGVGLVGGRDAGRAIAAIIRSVPDSANVVSFGGGQPLRDTAAVIRAARLFVGTDSGLAHLAIALGTPAVVIFGPSDHAKWGVQDERHAVVRRDLGCSPCCMFGYHRLCRTVDCMSAVGVEEVLRACDRVLAAADAEGTVPDPGSAPGPVQG